MRIRNGSAVLLLSLTSVTSLFAQSTFAQSTLAQSTSNKPPALPTPHPCESDPAYHKLDFWVGTWDVYDNHDGTLNGTDVVEKIVGGCAIVENWREADGSGEGKSLFYYQRARKQWKQVWVTDAGPIKEKLLVEETKDGGVRFQGEIPHPDGKSHLDRTTLTPLPDSRVHQVIEISRNAGKTWEIVFDAEYRRPR
jgi:hypothetical protein